MKTKIYFLVKDTVPVGFAITSIAHGAMMAHLEWGKPDGLFPVYKEWLQFSFRKVICKINAEEFAHMKDCMRHLVVTESALHHEETVLVLYPQAEKLPYELYS